MNLDDFEQLLNTINDPITVFCIEYDVGTAIRKLDPIVFEQMWNDYVTHMGE